MRALPPTEMAKLAADIEAMPKGDPKKIALKRFIGADIGYERTCPCLPGDREDGYREIRAGDDRAGRP